MRRSPLRLTKEGVLISAPMGVFLLLLTVAALHFGFILPLSRVDPRIWWLYNLLLALPYIGLAFALIDLKEEDALGLRGKWSVDALTGALLWVLLLGALLVIKALLGNGDGAPGETTPTTLLPPEEINRSSVFLVWLGIGVVVPIGEELFFRGYLISTLRRHLRSAVLAILISAVVWAVLHLRPWPSTLWLTLAGVAYGYARYFTSTRAAIIAHALHNSVIVALSLLATSIT